jgi:hypothetical protein
MKRYETDHQELSRVEQLKLTALRAGSETRKKLRISLQFKSLTWYASTAYQLDQRESKEAEAGFNES